MFLPLPCCSHAVFITPHFLFLPFHFLILGQREIIVLLPMAVTPSVVMATTMPQLGGPPSSSLEGVSDLQLEGI